MRRLATVVLVGALVAGCGSAKVMRNIMHGPPPEDLDSVFMLVHTYPTWEQEKREKLAKTLSSPFLDHGIRCKSYVYSELALNQDDVVAGLIKEEGPNYILEVRQVTGGTLPDGKPFLGFSFELRRTSTSEMIWESEVEGFKKVVS